MKKIENVMLCGLGAIGSIYAVKLFKVCNFKLILNQQRKISYKKNPLVFNGQTYKFNTAEKGDTADLIIIATKNNGFLDAVDSISSYVNDSTLILSLLNGIDSEELLKEKFNAENVPYAYFVGHTSTRNNRNVIHDGTGKIVFGEKNNKIPSENILKIKELFDCAQIDYEIPEDMDYSRWYKFMINVGTNQASAVLEAPYKLFQTSVQAMDFAKNLMKEVQVLAELEGVNHTENMLKEAVDTIMTMIPDAQTSMLQDILAKRKTEADIFSGTIMRLAKKHNIETPYNKIVYEIIKAKESAFV